MIPLTITPDIDRAPWGDLEPIPPLGELTRIGLMRNGTANGNAVVMFLVQLPDGTEVAGQTTWALFRSAVAVFNAGPIVAEEVVGP